MTAGTTSMAGGAGDETHGLRHGGPVGDRTIGAAVVAGAPAIPWALGPFGLGVLAMLALAVLVQVLGSGLPMGGRVGLLLAGGGVLATGQVWRSWRARERHLREAEAARRRDLICGALTASADPAMLADAEGRIVWVNPAFLEQTGYAERELVGATISKLEKEEGGDARWGSVLAGSAWKGEAQYVRGDGTSYVAILTLTPVRGEVGGVTHVLGIHRDGTVRREMELELRRLAEQQSREAEGTRQQLAGVSRDLEMFAYAVSHDLRAPLRAIDFFGRELVDHAGGALDVESRGYLDRVFTARRRMSMIIDAMMGLFHLGRGELRWVEVDLTEVATDVIRELQRASPGREVEVMIQPGMRVHADLRLLQAAVAALLDNAWKFTGRRTGARIEVGAQEGAEGRAYFVRDNGAGFNMAYADRLFTSIRRLHTQEEFEGCGIGLVSVARVLQRHQGRIWVEAVDGQGATFFFTLGPGPSPVGSGTSLGAGGTVRPAG